MSRVKEYGIKVLEEFVEDAEEMGICYGGADINEGVQEMVIGIVKDYIEFCKKYNKNNE